MKGRDKYGRPTEGVDEVPVRPPKSKEKQEFCLSQVVDMLQQANKREEELKDVVKFWSRKYHSLYQEHLTYKISDLCVDCQTRRDNAWYAAGEYRTYEKCDECKHKFKTIAVLKRELVEKDEQIRYWQDCYETALSERSEFPKIQLSQT